MKYLEKEIGKFKMRIKSKEGGIHSDLRKMKKGSTKEREPELLNTIKDEVKEGFTAIDLGANIGYITLLLSDLVGKKGKVLAIEPEPENFEILKYNLELNKIKNVEPINLAISDEDKKICFYIGKSSNLSSIIPSKNSTNKKIDVNCLTLTSLLKNKPYPNFVKMDTEGAEVEIFRGMYEYFKNNNDGNCLIILEIHPIFYSKKHNLEIEFKKFLEIGFSTKYVISAGVPIPDLFKKYGYTPDKVFRNRGVYTTITDKDMLYFSCHRHIQKVPGKKDSTKIVRYVGLYRGK